jgi:hypothetical protein
MVRESRLGICRRHVYHYRLTGKQLVFFAPNVHVVNRHPFYSYTS